MTDLRPSPSATCQACTLSSKMAKCQTCEFAPEPHEKNFDPRTMKLATAEDVARMYQKLWHKTLIRN